MIKMLVFDVDGTLYDLKQSKIPESTIIAIQKAKEAGCIFVIATGRAHYGLGKALNDLKPDYILAASGGVVADQKHHVLMHQDFTKKEVDQLLEFCHQYDAALVFKFLDHMYIYQHPEKIDWLEGQKNSDIGCEPFIDCFNQDQHLKDLPQGACIHADPKLVDKIFKNHERLQFVKYSSDGYDVLLKKVNKGTGLLALMNQLHLTKDEVMCFGDNYNDLEMMDVAGYSVAMGNAVDEVKQKATFITTPCNEDGIYHALSFLKII